jgi:hypothetical protein
MKRLNSAARYNVAFAIWCGVFLALGSAALAALKVVDRLPPPPLTATNCIDEKFKFLHETDIRSPSLLAVGSSVTWRNLDFSVLREKYGDGLLPLNAAPCFLYANQTAFLTEFLLDHMRSVGTVLSVFSMRDFSRCAGSPTEFFDREDAHAYVFQGDPSWPLYFKNFRPLSFLRDVVRLRDMRSGKASEAPLVMDEYGSGPLVLPDPEIRDDVRLDRSCVARLRIMGEDIRRRGIRFVVVLMPSMPAWKDIYDPGGVRDAEYRAEVARALAGTGAILIDADKELRLGNENFTDPAHLQWPSVPLLMEHLITKLEAADFTLAQSAERPADAL